MATPYPLGRNRMLYDPRDWKLSAFISAKDRERAKTIMVKEWSIDHLLDQGSTPHCVGFAWAHHAITVDEDGYMFELKKADGHALYYKACELGGYPGTENGSTTRDGARAAQALGYIKGYAFADTVEALETWLLTHGSIPTGVPWYTEMFYPDSDGLVHVKGSLEGGHEIEITKIDKNRGRLRFPNSWGGWGDGGFGEFTFDDYFGKLLRPYGDACTPVDRVPDEPTPDPVPDNPGCGARLAYLRRAFL